MTKFFPTEDLAWAPSSPWACACPATLKGIPSSGAQPKQGSAASVPNSQPRLWSEQTSPLPARRSCFEGQPHPPSPWALDSESSRGFEARLCRLQQGV